MNDHETLPESNKLVLKQFSIIGQQNRKPAALSPAKTIKDAPIWAKEKKQQPNAVDQLAKELVDKVQYNQLSQTEKIEFLDIQVSDKEQMLRTRTDETLSGGQAFNLVIENQRYFAICQDKYSNLAKKQREVIAFNSVRDVNDLIRQRRNL